MALYQQKKYVTRSTIYMESFILVSQSAQLSHYAVLLLLKTTSNSIPTSHLHVQSISHWAPANIGPYSQAFKVGS